MDLQTFFKKNNADQQAQTFDEDLAQKKVNSWKNVSVCQENYSFD